MTSPSPRRPVRLTWRQEVELQRVVLTCKDCGAELTLAWADFVGRPAWTFSHACPDELKLLLQNPQQN